MKSKIASKYSTNILIFLFLTFFLIIDPNAAHGAIDSGQIMRAIAAISKIEASKLIFAFRKPEATRLQMVHAFGFIS